MGFITNKRYYDRIRVGVGSKPALPGISPKAQQLAEDNQIDWTVLTGTSKSGMITLADVKEAIHQALLALPVDKEEVEA